MAKKESKRELLEKISSCELSILGEEKRISSILYNKRHEHRSLYCALEEMDLKYSSERKLWKQTLRQEIARVRNSVDAFHRMLLGTKPDPQFVEKLKQTMESIEASITAFKEKQREIYESLLQEEQSGNQEMNAFDRKLESWLMIPKAAHIRPEGAATSGSGQEESSSMHPAVIAFQRFLQQTGGREGGWDAYDHLIFLRVLSAQPPGAVLEVLSAELPTKTPKEIKRHLQWHVEYSTLLEGKRRAIEQWREQKERKKAEVKPTTPKVKRSSRQELLEREREARFAKLDAWKAEQKLKQMEAEELRLKEELAETRRKELENKRRVALKSRVEEYARQREEELGEQRAREEANRLRELAERRAASKELERFRARDMGALAERRRRAEVKEAERLEKERRLESLRTQVEVKVQRDPSRLYKLTKGWEERKKAIMEEGGGGGGAGSTTSLPRRAVPSWRQQT